VQKKAKEVLPVKKKVANQVEKVIYPFDEITKAYVCHCGTTLRRSNIHNRVYKVSSLDHDEILSNRPHICVKNKSKGEQKKK
jgi:hypothetical protein